MRASPAFHFALNRFGVWRCGVGVLAVLAVAVLLAWLALRAEPLPPLALGSWSGALVAVVLLSGSLMRPAVMMLRWDGRQWWLARTESMPSQAAEVDATPGDLEVALDLGGWMLLRFRPQRQPPSAALGDPRPTWLPVQRRGLEAHWHALRCAVYSPRPAPDRDAADPSS